MPLPPGEERTALIRDLINNARLSYQEVGKIVGLSKQRVSQIYHNRADKRKPRTTKLRNGYMLSSDGKKIQRKACVLCGSREKVQVHHIDGSPENNLARNLLTVCSFCHMRLHGLIPREAQIIDPKSIPSYFFLSKEIRLEDRPYSVSELSEVTGEYESRILRYIKKGEIPVLPLDNRQ
jgi:hypothetical protein